MRIFDTHELAWAAGFFDGEGSFYTQHQNVAPSGRRYQYPGVSVAQIEREPLERFRRAVGDIGSVSKTGRKARGNRQPDHWYHVGGLQWTQAIGALLWKWLSEPKREQFRRVMSAPIGRMNLPQ